MKALSLYGSTGFRRHGNPDGAGKKVKGGLAGHVRSPGSYPEAGRKPEGFPASADISNAL